MQRKRKTVVLVVSVSQSRVTIKKLYEQAETCFTYHNNINRSRCLNCRMFEFPSLRLPDTFRGVSRLSDVARPV